jgi:hypothetical protein
LVSLGLVAEVQLLRLLSKIYRVKAIDLSKVEHIDPSLLQIASKQVAGRAMILPLHRNGDTLIVAMADPANHAVLAKLGQITGLTIQPVVTTEFGLRRAIEKHYGMEETPAAPSPAAARPEPAPRPPPAAAPAPAEPSPAPAEPSPAPAEPSPAPAEPSPAQPSIPAAAPAGPPPARPSIPVAVPAPVIPSAANAPSPDPGPVPVNRFAAAAKAPTPDPAPVSLSVADVPSSAPGPAPMASAPAATPEEDEFAQQQQAQAALMMLNMEHGQAQEADYGGSGVKTMAIGAAILLAGIVMTCSSYSSAGPGDSYTVWTGLFVVGGALLVKGLFSYWAD